MIRLSRTPLPDLELSVILISWNTRDILAAALRSVLESVDPDRVEVIVVDNASEDGSPEMVRTAFPGVRLIENEANLGFAAANNIGLEVARGEFLLLLNSDTVVLGNVIEDSLAFLRARPEVGAMGCRVLNEDGSTQRTCSGFPGLGSLALQAAGLDRWSSVPFLDRYALRAWGRKTHRRVRVISGCYLMTRRRVLDQIGGLDPEFFFFGEETDWCRRVEAAGLELWFAPVGEIIHLGGASAKQLDARRDVLLSAALIRLHAKHFGPLRGRLCELLLLGFNGSRMALWGLAASIGLARGRARNRARHFAQVLAGWREVRTRAYGEPSAGA